MNQPSEKPTDELRQVVRTISLHEPSFFGAQVEKAASQQIVVIVAVQRKWLVQSGDIYIAAQKANPDDICVGHWVADGDQSGWQWAPMKTVWRDLPAVNQSTT